MITQAIDGFFRLWDDHRQRSFWRMVHLFVARIFAAAETPTRKVSISASGSCSRCWPCPADSFLFSC